MSFCVSDNSLQANEPKGFFLAFVILILSVTSDLFFSYFPIGPFPIRNYIFAFGITLILLVWLLNGTLYIRKGIPELTVILLSVLGIVGELSSGVLSFDTVIRLIKILIIPYGIYLITIFTFDSSKRFVNGFIIAVVFMTAFSSTIAVMQWLNIDFAWELRNSMPVGTRDEDSMLAVALDEHNRPSGMAYFPISLGFQVCWALPLAWYIAQKSSGFPRWIRQLGIASASALVLGGLASGTRSTFIALLVEFIYLMWAMGYVSLNFKNICVFSVVLLTMTLGLLYIQPDRWLLQDSSALGRTWLMYLGALFVLDHPLGQGFDWSTYDFYKQGIISSLYYLDNRLLSEIETFTPHNQFVNSAVIYGWFGFFVVLAFYYWIVRSLLNKSNDFISEYGYLHHSMIAGFLGYFVNSMFHNAGLFVGDHLGWYYFALAYWIVKIDTFANVNKSCRVHT